MREIRSIDHQQKKTAKDGRHYVITYATLDNGQDEVEGFGIDFKKGDKVEVFFDTKWNKIKMRKPDWDFPLDTLPDQD